MSFLASIMVLYCSCFGAGNQSLPKSAAEPKWLNILDCSQTISNSGSSIPKIGPTHAPKIITLQQLSSHCSTSQYHLQNPVLLWVQLVKSHHWLEITAPCAVLTLQHLMSRFSAQEFCFSMKVCQCPLGIPLGKTWAKVTIYGLFIILTTCSNIIRFFFFHVSGSEWEDFDKSWDYSTSLFFPSYCRNGWVKFRLSFFLWKKNPANWKKTQTPKHVINLSSSQPI